jgi:hypothetical protein
MQLSTKQVFVTPPPPPFAAQPAIPVQFVVQFVKPLSYEFRVAETMDADGKIAKVSLQMCIWEHDEFGTGNVKQTWHDVPRVRFDSNGAMMIP